MKVLNKKIENSISSINSKFTGKPIKGKFKEEALQELGLFVEVVAKDERRHEINIPSFLYWIKPAILHNQYLFFYDEGDINPTGYILWAWVDEKTLYSYLNSKQFILHPMCWNEGKNLIIVDFVCLNQSDTRFTLHNLYRKLRHKVSMSYKDVNVSIRNSEGSIIKHNRENSNE